MSSDSILDFDAGDRAGRSGVGAMLRERRIELSMSQADVANFVKLPVRRIEAMENERWEELPDGPFLRGFLKNIARALNLDAATLMDRVDDSLIRSRNPESILVPQGTTRAMLPQRSGPAAEHRAGRPLVFGAFVCALVAALIAWSGTESFERAVGSSRRLVEGPAASAPQQLAAPATSDAPVVKQGGSESVAATAPGASAGPDALAHPASSTEATARAEAAKALTLHFNEESWVEVRAADGRLLLQRLNPPGTEQTIDGEGPFTLIVGNAKGVALQFRGQPIDLSPYTRDQVARLTLS